MNKIKIMKAEGTNQIFGIERKGDSSILNITNFSENPSPKKDGERISYYGIGNKKKKPRNRLHLVRESNYKEGRWDSEEHQKFVKSCIIYGNNWRKVNIIFINNYFQVQKEIRTRSSAQIRSHAQKYVIRLCRKYSILTNHKKPYLAPGNLNPPKLKIPQKSFYDMEEDERKILEIFRIISKDHTITQNFEQIIPREKAIKKKPSPVAESPNKQTNMQTNIQNNIPKPKKIVKNFKPIFKIEKNIDHTHLDTEKLKERFREVYNHNQQVYNLMVESPCHEETLITMISNNGNLATSSQSQISASQQINEMKFLGTLQIAGFLDSMNKIYDQWSTLNLADFSEEEMKFLNEIGAPL